MLDVICASLFFHLLKSLKSLYFHSKKLRNYMFSGSIVAIVTPFGKNNKIDKNALSDLVAWHIDQKTDAIVCTGTTGEGATLSDREKVEVLDICLKASNKKIPIIAGTGTNDTKKSCQLTKKAKDMGADGVLAVVPYYNRPTQEGVIAHYSEIAKVGCPVIVYHHPGRTGVKLELSTFERISKIKNIVAIKEASGDLELIDKLLKASFLPLLSGDDATTVEVMIKGGKGVISVVANIVPSDWSRITKLCADKNFSEARFLINKYKLLCDSMFYETNPQCVKYSLSLMGKSTSYLRLPLLEPSLENKQKIKNILLDYHLIQDKKN